jgi:hypothetical protein
MFPICKLHPSKNALEHEVIEGFIFKLFYYKKKLEEITLAKEPKTNHQSKCVT